MFWSRTNQVVPHYSASTDKVDAVNSPPPECSTDDRGLLNIQRHEMDAGLYPNRGCQTSLACYCKWQAMLGLLPWGAYCSRVDCLCHSSPSSNEDLSSVIGEDSYHKAPQYYSQAMDIQELQNALQWTGRYHPWAALSDTTTIFLQYLHGSWYPFTKTRVSIRDQSCNSGWRQYRQLTSMVGITQVCTICGRTFKDGRLDQDCQGVLFYLRILEADKGATCFPLPPWLCWAMVGCAIGKSEGMDIWSRIPSLCAAALSENGKESQKLCLPLNFTLACGSPIVLFWSSILVAYGVIY